VIAVVDDEESVRKAVVRLLQAVGFTARAFASGADFLESWAFDRPDCVLLDWMMPGLSGMEVLQSLRTAGADFPIVIITAHDSPTLREECMSAGAIAYLCKPLDVQVLIQAVSRRFRQITDIRVLADQEEAAAGSLRAGADVA
jgi:FixJ family two-component response regulator